MNKTIKELAETFVYLALQHDIKVTVDDLTETSFTFSINDEDLINKCTDLAISVGLFCAGHQCSVKELAPVATVTKSIFAINDSDDDE